MPWTTRYTVKGRPPFPVDMLRYDGSYPSREHDSAVIVMCVVRGAAVQDSVVTLTHKHQYRKWRPSEDRWLSFGWRVVDLEVPRKAV